MLSGNRIGNLRTSGAGSEGTTSDLISRQDAIDVLGVFTQADALGHTPKQIVEALPSAHQEIEERKEESAQNVPIEDLISRKAAIDAVKDADVCVAWNGVISNEDAVDIAIRATKRSVIGSIEELPSAQPEVLACGEGVLNAQPEIVRCKTCKFYIDHRCYEPHSSIADWKTENDYCSFAERRTDE